MSYIESVHAIIHPDFYLMEELNKGDLFVHHDKEVQIREKWDATAVYVAKNPNTRLVYMTWLSERELKVEEGIDHPWKELDHERQEEYKWMLGDRMTVMPRPQIYTPEVKAKILRGQLISNKTLLYKEGEWEEACRDIQGQALGQLLGIDARNIIPIPEGSISRVQGEALVNWHKLQRTNRL